MASTSSVHCTGEYFFQALGAVLLLLLLQLKSPPCLAWAYNRRRRLHILQLSRPAPRHRSAPSPAPPNCPVSPPPCSRVPCPDSRAPATIAICALYAASLKIVHTHSPARGGAWLPSLAKVKILYLGEYARRTLRDRPAKYFINIEHHF